MIKNLNKSQGFIIAAGVLSLIWALCTPALFVNIPCRDDWDLVSITCKIIDQNVTFWDVWMPHLEHRMVLSRFILSSWAAATRWNMMIFPWLDLALIFLAAVMLTGFGSEKSKTAFWQKSAFWASCVFLFSLAAIKTINWAIVFAPYLSSAMGVYAVWAVSKKPEKFSSWVLAAIFSAVGTFSFGIGVAIWVALIPMLILVRTTAKAKQIYAFWFFSSILSLTLYFYGLPHSSGILQMGQLFQNSFVILHFMLQYLGAIFHPLSATFMGAMGLFFAVFLFVYQALYLKKLSLRQTAFCCVFLFVILNAGMTAIVRYKFGADYAIAERYIVTSCYFWATLIVWMTDLLNIDESGPDAMVITLRQYLRPAYFLFISFSLLIAPLHWWNFEDNRDYLKSLIPLMHKYKLSEEELLMFFEHPETVKEGIVLLKSHKLSIFNSPQQANSY